VIQDHPHRAGSDLGRKLVRRLACHGSTFSGVGASDKPGAVHPLINNHFGRRALLRGRLRLHAINATALIEETVTTAALSARGVAGHRSFAGRLNKPARTNSRQPRSMNFSRDGARQVGAPRQRPREPFRGTPAPDRMSRCVPAEGRLPDPLIFIPGSPRRA
jgi:hypothetical protein